MEAKSRQYCPECFREFTDGENVCFEHGISLISLPEEQSLIGKVLDGKYRILEQIGAGGMGKVYKAKQKYINRVVALKVLRSDFAKDVSAVKRFFVEARAAAQLRSRNSVILFDFGLSQEHQLFYTMECLKGQSLARTIRRGGPVEPRRAMKIAIGVCHALEEAHKLGIVHRDLKPDNIQVVPDEDNEIAKVMDFGIAKLLTRHDGTSLTKTGMICGTPEYMSPEQAVGKDVGPLSDLYSLGIVLYEMLAGFPPFKDTTPVLILMKHVNDVPVPVSSISPPVNIPEELDRLLIATLSKDKGKRPPSAKHLREALEGILEQKDSGGSTVLMRRLSTTADGLRQIETPLGPRAVREEPSRPPESQASEDKPPGEQPLADHAPEPEPEPAPLPAPEPALVSTPEPKAEHEMDPEQPEPPPEPVAEAETEQAVDETSDRADRRIPQTAALDSFGTDRTEPAQPTPTYGESDEDEYTPVSGSFTAIRSRITAQVIEQVAAIRKAKWKAAGIGLTAAAVVLVVLALALNYGKQTPAAGSVDSSSVVASAKTVDSVPTAPASETADILVDDATTHSEAAGASDDVLPVPAVQHADVNTQETGADSVPDAGNRVPDAASQAASGTAGLAGEPVDTTASSGDKAESPAMPEEPIPAPAVPVPSDRTAAAKPAGGPLHVGDVKGKGKEKQGVKKAEQGENTSKTTDNNKGSPSGVGREKPGGTADTGPQASDPVHGPSTGKEPKKPIDWDDRRRRIKYLKQAAERLFNRGRYEDALAKYEEVAELTSGISPELNRLMSKCRKKLRDVKHAEQLVKEGKVLLRDRSFAQALSKFEKAGKLTGRTREIKRLEEECRKALEEQGHRIAPEPQPKEPKKPGWKPK